MAAAAHHSGPPTTATATGKIITINIINITLMIFIKNLLRVVSGVAVAAAVVFFALFIHLFIYLFKIYIHSFINLLIQVLCLLVVYYTF